MSPIEYTELRRQIDELFCSTWYDRVWVLMSILALLISKKDGNRRLHLDGRDINRIIVEYKFIIPIFGRFIKTWWTNLTSSWKLIFAVGIIFFVYTKVMNGRLPLKCRRFGSNFYELEIFWELGTLLVFNMKDLTPYHTLVDYLMIFPIFFFNVHRSIVFSSSSTTTTKKTSHLGDYEYFGGWDHLNCCWGHQWYLVCWLWYLELDYTWFRWRR